MSNVRPNLTAENLLQAWEEIEKRLPQATGQSYLQKQLAGGALSLSAAVRVEDAMPGLLLRLDEFPSGTSWQPTRLAGMRFEPILKLGKGIALPILLSDESARDVFALLAADLASAISEEESAGAGLRQVLARLNLWRNFLKTRTGKMSEEEVRGLIGEVGVLLQAIAAVGVESALDSWKGPSGDLHDFRFEAFRMEVKTWVNDSIPQVTISDPSQLICDPAYPVCLCAVKLSASVSQGATVEEWIRSVKAAMTSTQSERFESMLADYGYLTVHSELYSQPYAIQSLAFYRIAETFPRLRFEDIPPAVPWVKYGLNLGALAEFQTPSPF